MSELDAKFQVAVDFVAAKAGNRMTNEQVTRVHSNALHICIALCIVLITSCSVLLRLASQRLTLYAFYKQALFGACTVEKPSAADFVGSAKWYHPRSVNGVLLYACADLVVATRIGIMCRESWRALGKMDSEVAKEQYLEWVKDLFEDFDVTGSKKRRASSASGASKASREELSLGNSISTAGVVSMPTVDMYVCLFVTACGWRWPHHL